MKKRSQSIVFKSLTGVIILMIIFFVMVGYIGYQGITKILLHQYEEGAYRTARTAVDLVPAENIDEYAASGGETLSYRLTESSLRRFCNLQNVTFIYVIQPDRTDYDHITFIFSVMNDSVDFTEYEFGYVRQTTNDEYKQKYRALYEGTMEEATVVRDRGYIETEPHLTAMIPLKTDDGEVKAILCVQRQMASMNRVRNGYLKRIFFVLIGLLIIMISGQVIYLRKTLLTPLKKITDEASRFAVENVQAKEKLSDTIKNKDEIGMLAASVDRMEEQIHDYIQNITRITEERGRIETELSLAARIQANMLPSVFPPFPDRKEFDIYATMIPAKEVGGDFYDFFLIDDDHLGLVIADVSGKGIPASLFMMMSKIIIQNYTLSGMTPSEVLETINTQICRNNEEEMFITVWLGILDIRSGKLTASNAGHEYPVLKMPDGGFQIYRDKHGFVIGGMEGMKYKDYTMVLEPGSVLYLYTDGVPEATDTDSQLFGMERTLAELNKISDPEPELVLKRMNNAVDQFVKGAPRFDDTTMLCVRYNGVPKTPEEKEMTVEAVTGNMPTVTDFVLAELERLHCPKKAQMQISIAIDELFGNIVHYAYRPDTGPATVRVEVEEDPLAVVITFIDNGRPFDPLSQKEPDVTLSAEEREVGGLGIFMVRKAMDQVTYEYKNGQNILRIKKNMGK